jgi:hypothetical protein
MADSGNKFVPRFCTNPALALLWQHANNSPRECFESLVATFDKDMLNALFGNGVTTCVLRSLLPAYISLCDQRTIECEESVQAIPEQQFQSCLLMQGLSRQCDPQCIYLLNQLSSGQKCFERTAAVRETLAQISNLTCSDSGKRQMALHFLLTCLLNLPSLFLV